MKKLMIRTAAFLAVLALLAACAPALPVTGGGGAAPVPTLVNTVTILPTATTAPATVIPPTAAPSPTMNMPTTAPQTAAPTDSAQPDDAQQVSIANFAFSPDTLTIPVGTKVRWTNKDSAAHTVTADNGTFDSGTLNTGATFAVTFSEPGTYTYFCAFHANMVGKIIVTGAGAPPSGSDSNNGMGGSSQASPTPDSGSGNNGGSGGYNY